MKPAISQVCSLHSSMQQDIEDYAAGACDAIEIWFGKLETYLENHRVEDFLELLSKHQMVAPVASFQGGLLTSDGEKRKAHWEHFQARLQLCQQLNIETMILAADIMSSLDQQKLEIVNRSLIEAAALAAEKNVRLAVEFQARSTLMNNLQTTIAMIEELQQPNLGICFDLFHYYTGPSKFEDLAYLTADNLFHVQLCDLVGQARELATDADRILPGDGDFSLSPIIEHLKKIGYEGYISVELMNPQIWQIPARQFGEVAITALRKVLGQASME